jgi:hypothetical protein
MIKNRFLNTLPCKIFNSVTLIIVKSMWYITFVSYNDSLNFSDYSIPGGKLLLFGLLTKSVFQDLLVSYENVIHITII